MRIIVCAAWLFVILGVAGIAVRCLKQNNILASLLFLALTMLALFAFSDTLEQIPTTCPLCGYASNSSFCTNCGACLEEKAPCLNCGNEIDQDELYCGNCGVRTYSDSQEEQHYGSTKETTGENK